MREFKIIAIIVMAALAVISIFFHKNNKETIYYEMPEHKAEPVIEVEYDTLVSDLDLLERCVQAEAGNQGLTGKRLVAAVILNRVESEKFPNTIPDVINEPGQFAVVWNKSIERVEVDDETRVACRTELKHRCRSDVLYFNNSAEVSGRFCYKYKDHWFGK